MKRYASLFSLALLFTLWSGCDNGTEPPPVNDKEVNQYLTDLPTWDSFSPQGAVIPPTQTGPAVAMGYDTLDVEVVNDSGTIDIYPDVVYECQSVPYTIQDNPQQIVMYSPDREILWPGALIQGKSYKDGRGSFLGLIIRERTPIKVSIPSLANNDNFREVSNPEQATVEQAIGSMIGNATAQGLSTPSTITFEQEVYHTEEEFALKIGVSGRYLGFSASASGSTSRNSSETTVTAYFYQKMYEVVVAPPQTPGGFFSGDFTQEKLQEQIDLRRIGPDNLPVYVSNIVYGRMMMFSFTSTASESDIRGTLRAAYNGIGGGGSGSLSAKQHRILQESRIAVTSLGGNAEATIELIQSGDWSRYFTDSAPLSSAEPLSYTFRNLSDGSIAKVTEATNYNINQCTEVVANPGTFNFLNVQSNTLPVPVPVTATLKGDFNGDGLMDLLWNHLSSTNQFAVGLGGGGTITSGPNNTHPTTPAEGWANFTPVVIDYDGDGNDDLAWSHLSSVNIAYLARSNGDGTFGDYQFFAHNPGGWSPYQPYAADINGDGKEDLVFNELSANNRTYVCLSNGDGSFTSLPSTTRQETGWHDYHTLYVADFNGDGRDDLMWSYTGGINRTYISFGNADGSLSHRGLQDHPARGWDPYVTLVGNVNGDSYNDIIWTSTLNDNTNRRTYVGLNQGGGTLGFPGYQDQQFPYAANLEAQVGDFNGDGRSDIIFWESLNNVNKTMVFLGRGDGMFDVSRVTQDHPEVSDWEQFHLFVGDIDGDGNDDAVWNHPANNNRFYIGIAR